MSEMKLHVAVRYVFLKEYEDTYDMYDLIRPILGNASYVSSSKDGKVSSFEYDTKKGNWCIYRVDNSNKWVADYMLETESTFDGDLDVSYELVSLQVSSDNAHTIGLGEYLDMYSGRIYVYTWYNGSDMPVEWQESNITPKSSKVVGIVFALILTAVIGVLILTLPHKSASGSSNAVLDGGYDIGVEPDDSFGGFEEDLDPDFSYGGE